MTDEKLKEYQKAIDVVCINCCSAGEGEQCTSCPVRKSNDIIFKEQQKSKALSEMYKAIEEFQKVWCKCESALLNAYIDCNDYIVDNYPFHRSFDEIEVDTWCESVLDNIASEIDGRTRKGE